MTHSDRGHYAKKHQGKEVDQRISSALKQIVKENNISCVAAHKSARDLSVSPCDIGVQADLMELRITHCQLGLFGYKGGEKKIDLGVEIPSAMDQAIEKIVENSDNKDRISCLEAWNLAEKLGAEKIDVASACEKKEIRIKPCQLGAF